MGLANSLYPSKLKPLIDLLVDPEWGARCGAIRAMAALGTDSALLLLRYKALIGDENPEIAQSAGYRIGDVYDLDAGRRQAHPGGQVLRAAHAARGIVEAARFQFR